MNKNQKIIVADDSPEVVSRIVETLTKTYNVIAAKNGLEVIDLVTKNPSSITCIIMGKTMPQLDGLQTTKKLKDNFTTYHIPIIIMTRNLTTKTMVHAVEMGADDYMRKPIDLDELKARLVMNIRRSQRDQNSNPLTKLPGNNSINKTIQGRIHEPLAILYADLDNFKAYNDKYGFNKGDEIIKYTADILTLAVRNHGNTSDFVGHIGGDDFVIVSTPDKADAISHNICERFDQNASLFYNEEDRTQKKIITKDRRGNECAFPLASISVAIVTNEKKELVSMPQIAQLAAELKKYAKSKPSGKLGSNYVNDRRGSE